MICHKCGGMVKMQRGGSLPQFQVAGWVQRAANAEYSCAANPRSNLREATEVSSGGKGDPYRDSKNERWKAQSSEWKNQGITKEDFNNAFNDSSRMGNTFMNPEYAKYFDPANGQVKSEYNSIRNNLNPRVKYYAQAPGFPMGQRPTIQKILDFQMSQPGGLEGYRQLSKDDYPYNVNPFIPVKKDGGQHGGLDRWFAEKWVDIKTGKACGRQEGESRAGYPACRPSKRVNSQTPKTASELSTAEREKFKRTKTSSQRINYNHKRNK
jgi:hypothetical protein